MTTPIVYDFDAIKPQDGASDDDPVAVEFEPLALDPFDIKAWQREARELGQVFFFATHFARKTKAALVGDMGKIISADEFDVIDETVTGFVEAAKSLRAHAELLECAGCRMLVASEAFALSLPDDAEGAEAQP